jgi:hypothetical protein
MFSNYYKGLLYYSNEKRSSSWVYGKISADMTTFTIGDHVH